MSSSESSSDSNTLRLESIFGGVPVTQSDDTDHTADARYLTLRIMLRMNPDCRQPDGTRDTAQTCRKLEEILNSELMVRAMLTFRQTSSALTLGYRSAISGGRDSLSSMQDTPLRRKRYQCYAVKPWHRRKLGTTISLVQLWNTA